MFWRAAISMLGFMLTLRHAMNTGLDPNEAHLWLVDPDTIDQPELLQAYERLLSDDERERRDRFRFPEHQHLFLVSHVLVRTVLSRYADVGPGQWRFVTNEHGRPEISEPVIKPSLKFNLSHTKGMAACLVSLDREVGVDVENCERSGDLLRVADRFFSPSEVRDLQALPVDQQWRRFFCYWTLKESYIKAKGKGFAIPLAQFSFDLDKVEGGGIHISFDPRLQDDPAGWRFFLFSYGKRHTVAAGIRHRGDLDLHVRETVPLADVR
jgi:4'-phosphopantetheinyl transferase